MKKLLFVVVAAAGAVLAKRRYDDSRADHALWAEATDSVDRA